MLMRMQSDLVRNYFRYCCAELSLIFCFSGLSELTGNDIDDIRAFSLRYFGQMPRRIFKHMRNIFSHKMDINSEYVILHRMAILSQVEPKWYDCCSNSCLCYAGQWAKLTVCSYCQTPRYDAFGKPVAQFCYIPIVPWLQALFHHPHMANLMLYRAHFEQTPNNGTRDYFDSDGYAKLRDTYVVIDGERQGYKYFNEPTDVAFCLSGDGFRLFKNWKTGPSAIPLVIQVLNLPPTIRTHIEHTVCFGILPPPKQPRDVPSYLVPFEEECVALAQGVRTWNASTRTEFLLRGYVTLGCGDILMIEKMLDMKGHNSVLPCRSCKIRGVRNAEGGGKTYYYPLTLPGEKEQTYDPYNLPLRMHDDWKIAVKEIESISKDKPTIRNRVAMHHGIKGMPVFGHRVQSIDYANSFSWESVHMFFENLFPNMVMMWKGTYRGLNSGAQKYIIVDSNWEKIGAETAACVSHIPSEFVRVLQNIHTDQSNFTAESWSFWMINIAPIVLKGRFPDEKFYDHFMELVEITKKCLKDTLTGAEKVTLRDDIVNWVKFYERFVWSSFSTKKNLLMNTYVRYYYQFNADRLPACNLIIHGLLHLVDGIDYNGPVWVTWSFFMERFCGILKQKIKQKSNPRGTLNSRILEITYFQQLPTLYEGVDDILEVDNTPDTSKFEKIIPGCKWNILLYTICLMNS